MDTLTITRPDDWHLHLRAGAALKDTVRDAARHFARAIVMPNLKPPIVTTEQAAAYRTAILEARPRESTWQPLMTLYLTKATSPGEIDSATSSGFIHGVKYYPAGATTHSEAGVTDIDSVSAVLERMEKNGLPLLIHGEVTDPEVDIFDREAVFIDRVLAPLMQRFSELKIVLEHITTSEAVQFVGEADSRLAATITPQHLLFNRNQLLSGGIRPHYYCLPVLKRDSHQKALINAATSGSPKYFLGTDSAPHGRHDKETACGCAGCYSHHAAIELYSEVFETAGALDKLEAFASFYGADFYGLPRNSDTVTLRKSPWQLPESCSLGDEELIPMHAGETLQWQVVSD